LLSAEDDDPAITGDEGNGGDEGDGEADEEVKLDMSDEKWQSLGEEFQDFMNEEGDSGDESETDSESVRSDLSAQNKRKRKRSMDSAESSEAEESDGSTNSDTGTKLQKKKKRALERTTSLNNVVTADKSSGLPSPDTTGPDEGQGDEDNGNGFMEDIDDDSAALEAELMAEFERESDEEVA